MRSPFKEWDGKSHAPLMIDIRTSVTVLDEPAEAASCWTGDPSGIVLAGVC